MCKNSIFSNISTSEWNRMLQCFQPVVQSFEAGEYIMTFSEHLERIGILLSGTAHLTYTDADGNQVSLKGKKVLDAANCAVGEDGQLPPRELFTRVGMDRYTKVTGDDGNTYYVYNEEDENDPTTLYSLNNISINKELRKQITLMPYKNQNGTDYPLVVKLFRIWFV